MLQLYALCYLFLARLPGISAIRIKIIDANIPEILNIRKIYNLTDNHSEPPVLSSDKQHRDNKNVETTL